jgi:hypothetical protein
MQTERLRAHLSEWGHAHEDTAEGWIAHGFSEGLALANRAPAKGFVGLTWLWGDEAREHIRRGRAAAGDRAIAYLYEEALKAGYQIGRDLIALNEEQAGGER